MINTFDFDRILNSCASDRLPPVDLWHPELSGDIDIQIDKQGVWRYCGEEFKRQQIPKMFSRILCKEEDEYYLKTPVEKWRIQVEDVPFFFIHMQKKERQNTIEMDFVSLTEDVITLNESNPLTFIKDNTANDSLPYIYVRGAMLGKLSRNLYYELVDSAEINEEEQKLYISSAGKRFLLGHY